MRAVGGLGLGLVGLLVVMVYWLGLASGGEKAALAIPIAWGQPGNGQIEMHAVIGVALANQSRRSEKTPSSKALDWNKWIQSHCILKAASGEAVPLLKANHSPIIKPHEIQPMIGTEEFFLTAGLKAGTSYTFDYVIEEPQPTVYRCQFTAPHEPEKVRMYRFELTK